MALVVGAPHGPHFLGVSRVRVLVGLRRVRAVADRLRGIRAVGPAAWFASGQVPLGSGDSGSAGSASCTAGIAGSVRSPRRAEATFWKCVIGVVGGVTLASSSGTTSPRTT